MPSLTRTFLTGVGSFLPNEPIDNERVEAVLGLIGGKPSRARRRILQSNGITERYYAIDPETGLATHNNRDITLEAIKRAADYADFDLKELDCIACGTSTPDQLMPNHALMVHGDLGIPPCEVVATTGTCLSGLTALKYAAMAVAIGQTKTAIATGSELASALVRASNFPNAEPTLEEVERSPVIGFGKEFLRWMLSDGAGAVLLTDKPAPKGLSLEIEWIEIVSFANELEPCMYWGAEKQKDGELVGWRQAPSLEHAVETGMMNLTQDARLLGREVGRTSITEGLGNVLERRPMKAEDIDWFLPHYSSDFFRSEVHDRLQKMGFPIPYEKWFTNLTEKGNTGSASIFIMLDELVRSGQLKAGEKVLCMVPESARFSVGYALLTVVGPEG
ncbi:MAG: 3-oxoacyl-[acyl-carrier-protein] synthase-3 [Planctomycetota bacterium]|jgi:3-oxoacyl-[acyl-carrier-protein] synthase-3